MIHRSFSWEDLFRDLSGGMVVSFWRQGGGELTLHYWVNDRLHRGKMHEYFNRFNGDTVLHPGWNDIVIPMIGILYGLSGRTMDVTKIRGFGLFVMRQTDSRVLYLDNVRLF